MSEAKVIYCEGSVSGDGPIVVVSRVHLTPRFDVSPMLYLLYWEWRKWGRRHDKVMGFHTGVEVAGETELGKRAPSRTYDATAIRWGIAKYDELAAIQEWPEEELPEYEYQMQSDERVHGTGNTE